MYFPPLQPLQNSQYNVSGDVLIDPSAAIAPGVLLQADPEARIAIASGVCIGMGTIVHASKGTVAVESGASLGAGVLIVGKSKIGANACVGSMTTIINIDIEQGQVVPPGSLLGEDSRKVLKDEQSKDSKYAIAPVAQDTALSGAIVNTTASVSSASSRAETPNSDPIVNTPAVQASINSAVARNASANTPPMNSPGHSIPTEAAAPKLAEKNSTSDTPSVKEAEQQPESESASENKAIVYGQEQLDELMGTLFPHNKSWRKQQSME